MEILEDEYFENKYSITIKLEELDYSKDSTLLKNHLSDVKNIVIIKLIYKCYLMRAEQDVFDPYYGHDTKFLNHKYIEDYELNKSSLLVNDVLILNNLDSEECKDLNFNWTEIEKLVDNAVKQIEVYD